MMKGIVPRAVNQEINHKEENVAARTAGSVGECHEMPIRRLAKTTSRCLKLSFDGGLNLGQVIAGSPGGILAGLSRLTDCSGE